MKRRAMMLAGLLTFAACSQDMQEQPSYAPQEAPRLHSPTGSISRAGRRLDGGGALTSADGARLFAINCAHCHGADAAGDGPVGAYLKERPKDLRAGDMRTVSETGLVEVMTNGGDVMPSFRTLLTSDERRAIAAYIKSLGAS